MKQGETIAGRYRLDRLLGEGGMGSVWAATHTITGKAVAIKFLKAELVTEVSVVQRFLREARAACAVRHPNVVQIHDVLTLESGVPVLVMDLLEGESLGAKLAREHRLSRADFVRIMTPVVAAVATAHAASIVHRDLKPDNVFLAKGPDGAPDVKVLDFGIAKINATDEEGGHLTKTGSMLGTPFYMSPEQLFGEKDVDGRSDIWSLGIIFYQCLSGVLPTQADNLGQIIKTVTAVGITPLAKVAPHVPPDIASLVDRMLSRERDGRPTLDEIRSVLARHAEENLRPSGRALAWGAQAQPGAAIAPVTAMAVARTESGAGVLAPSANMSVHDPSARPRAHPIAAAIVALGVVALGVGGTLAFPWLKARFFDAGHERVSEAPTQASASSAGAGHGEANAGDTSGEPSASAAAASASPSSSPSSAAAAASASAAGSASPAAAGATSADAPSRASASPPGPSTAKAPSTTPTTAQPAPPKPTPTGTAGLLEEKVPF